MILLNDDVDELVEYMNVLGAKTIPVQAGLLKQMYDELIAKGFTAEQAFELVKTIDVSVSAK